MDGSVVSRATLHNLSIMKEIFGARGPFIGQRISAYKANMITPQIYEAYDTDEEETLSFSKICCFKSFIILCNLILHLIRHM